MSVVVVDTLSRQQMSAMVYTDGDVGATAKLIGTMNAILQCCGLPAFVDALDEIQPVVVAVLVGRLIGSPGRFEGSISLLFLLA